MLVLVVVAMIIALAIIATVLAIAIAVMVARVHLVASTVAAFMAMASIAAVVAVVVIVAAVAVMIVMLVSIVRTSSTSITSGRLGAAFAWLLRARFLGGLLGFLLLELVEHAICLISILTLFEEADECDVVVGQHFMRLRILLLMLPRHQKEDLLDLLRLCGQLHGRMKEPLLMVAHELHSSSHVVMHRHEYGLLSRTKPVDQLVADV